jgi:TPR repeat protein
MQALQAGNYAEAYCLRRPLADQGLVDAQYHLGWPYANGNGLAVDIERALAFWGAAARQGHADAHEILLGLNGEGALDIFKRHLVCGHTADRGDGR